MIDQDKNEFSLFYLHFLINSFTSTRFVIAILKIFCSNISITNILHCYACFPATFLLGQRHFLRDACVQTIPKNHRSYAIVIKKVRMPKFLRGLQLFTHPHPMRRIFKRMLRYTGTLQVRMRCFPFRPVSGAVCVWERIHIQQSSTHALQWAGRWSKGEQGKIICLTS